MSKHGDRGGQQVVQLLVSEMRNTFFVRKALDPDRVLFFAELYEAGAEVPPLTVLKGSLDVVKGKHRHAALEMLGRTYANCILADPPESRIDLVVEAFADNLNGSLPPQRGDYIFVMRRLLEEGASQRQIVDKFAQHLPAAVARSYVRDAVSEYGKAKMKKAVAAVAHGNKNAQEAATEHGVSLEALQAEISGVKRNKKKNNGSIAEFKSELSNRYRGNSRKTAAAIKKLFDMHHDGEISTEKVDEVLAHLRGLLNQGQRSYADWAKRFEARKGKVRAM